MEIRKETRSEEGRRLNTERKRRVRAKHRARFPHHPRIYAKKYASADERRLAQRLRDKYGLSLTDYRALHGAQGSRCASCGDQPMKLQVDHDHVTGRVRGLLCGPCNILAGWMESHPERVSAVRVYLERP
jgi:hypothetical protein